MKKSSIKNIEMIQAGQYFSYGININKDLIVINIISKYFPFGVTVDTIQQLMNDNHFLNQTNEDIIFEKLKELLMNIKNSNTDGKSLFSITKKTKKVELIQI